MGLEVVPGTAATQSRSLLTETTHAASGAYSATSVLKVTGYRTITLLLNIDAAAAGGFPSIVPRGAAVHTGAQDTPPAFGDDVWYCFGVTDGVPVATLGTGTRATGVDYTNSPEFGRMKFRPLEIVSEAHDGATDEIRMAVSLDISWCRWFSIEYAEDGATGTPGAITIDYVLHA